jgi:hypothetical protein
MDKRREARMIDARTVAIYHIVHPHEGFEESACAIFLLVRRAQAVTPGKRRNLFLDIDGHRNGDGGFDASMVELQHDFLLGFLAPFLCEVHTPLGTLRNPRRQDDDLPDELVIAQRPPESV